MPQFLLAEFETPEALATAARALRQAGYRKLDAYTPYSTEVVRDALELPESRLPIFILGAGLVGAGLAYLLQWWLVAFLYPLNVGGRPAHMPLAFVPISFEMGVLLASFTAVFGFFRAGKLLRWWDPVFEVEGFESASVDRFWLSIAGDDARFDAERTPAELDAYHPLRQVLLEGLAP
jgi:hypothetical protein